MLLALTTTVQAGGLYKWVDEKGQVQFSDKPPPPQNLQKGSLEQLSKRGIVVKKIDPVLTAEQQAAEAKKKELETQEADQRRRDNALIKSYTKPEEVDLLRDRSLEVLDGEIKSFTLQRKTADTHLARVNERIASFEQRKKPVPPDLLDEKKRGIEEVQRIDSYLKSKEQEKITVRAKAAEDKKRLIELKGTN
jgi:hypothetical protein